MALRKKYQEDAAIASLPQKAGPATETVAATEAPQPEAKPSPAEEAARSAIRERLAETERATTFVPPSPQQDADDPQQPLTPEEIIEKSGLPESAQRWLKKHPEYISDLSKNSEIIALHNTARRQAGGEEWTPTYFEKMESLLGMRPEPAPQPRPQTNGSQHVRQQRPYRGPYRGPPVSAAPTRDVPTFSGRPMNYRAPLTADEKEVALASRLPGQKDEHAFLMYQSNKERVRQLKDSGVIQ